MSKCRITVVKKDLYADLIARYCDPAAVPCEVFEVGDEFLVDQESFFNLRFLKPSAPKPGTPSAPMYSPWCRAANPLGR